MASTILAVDFSLIISSKQVVLLDIRQVQLYETSHLPSAISIPCDFKKSQYKKLSTDGQGKAIEYQYPALHKFALKHQGQQVYLLYQEHGMRTQIARDYLQRKGVFVIEIGGGFLALIRYIKSYVYEEYEVEVLIGLTGSGKSERLSELAKQGKPVINLQKMAKHKGSAFGTYAGQSQPSSEQFAIDLFFHMMSLNKEQSIYIEYEHLFLGSVQIPTGIQTLIIQGNKHWLRPTKEQRITRIVKEYSALSLAQLLTCLQKIENSISKKDFQICSELIGSNQLKGAAAILLNYYDQHYLNQFERLI